ncbi:transglutaminaseTgpA domain-containing protein [Marinagarivorans algicola]|uniref:transglutaminase family protein n=1 Tax=Marinagarivorans algicola TaxID=1513270 RepID=UPI0006B4838A|nr:DUF3488 and transglutaminase-like domain-containing protein [Marinagarivorans algicola]
MDASIEAFEQHKLIRHENLLWLIVAQGVAIVPLLFHLPPWMWLVWLGAMVWRLRIYNGKLAFPATLTKFMLGAACVGGLMVSYRGQVGVEPMIGFLVCAFILKLLELRTHKDGLLLLFIGFIAVGAQFLFTQTFFMAFYAWTSCVALVTAWQTIYLTRRLGVVHKLKSGFFMLLHALPLMVVMFVIMPRLGPLWHVPLPQGTGQTGFSDSLSPGDLGQLVKSQGTAFRVNFNAGRAPSPNEMYWRGLVLDEFDGRTWRLSAQWDMTLKNDPRFVPKLTGANDLIDYTVQLEPHQYPWLFALAEPIKVTSIKATRQNIHITQQGLLTAHRPVASRIQYTVLSASADDLSGSALSAAEQAQLLRLPAGTNPQAQALGQSWREQYQAPQAIIATALTWYNQDFHYTLEPPVLGKHSVDEFLLTTKRGFCEHFASSFAVLMRAAGIPARVVVGYQGGTYNALEDYWRISQSDAHAWVEVWLANRWQRVDPTSAVAPQRIEQGIGSALGEQDRALVGAGHYQAPQWLGAWRERMDAAGYVWNRWVLNYDTGKQSELFARWFGGTEPWRIGAVFIGLIAGMLGGYTLWVIRPHRSRKTPLQKAIEQFDKTCLKLGYVRYREESLALFAHRLAEQKKEYETACHDIARISEHVLYRQDHTDEAALMTALKQFPKPVHRP